MMGEVTAGGANNLRDAPAGTRIGQIPALGVFTVLEGAQCVDGFNWYQVEYDGTVGWTAEADETAYWIIPVFTTGQVISQDNITQLTVMETIPCPDGQHFVSQVLSYGGRLVALRCQLDNQINLIVADLFAGTQMTIAVNVNDGYRIWQLLTFTPFADRIVAYELVDDVPYLHIWDTATGEQLASVVLGENRILDWQISANGRTISALSEADLTLYDGETLSPILTTNEIAYSLNTWERTWVLALNDDGTQLATADFAPNVSEFELQLWDINRETGTLESVFAIDDETQPLGAQLLFSPSGRSLIFSNCTDIVPSESGGTCLLASAYWYDTSDGSLITEWDTGVLPLLESYFNPRASLIMTREYGVPYVYDVTTGERVSLIVDYTESRILYTFSRDSRRLLGESSNFEGLILYGVP